MDGVSCSVCHQIREAWGCRPVTTAVRDRSRTAGRGTPGVRAYSIEEDQAAIMKAGSGYVPAASQHSASSEMCATCHTLYTPYLDAGGTIAGEFPEQMPYLEWFYSDYRRTASCADCHMPEAQGGVAIASSSTNPCSLPATSSPVPTRTS
jgi:cytochrome c peroxidase